MAKYVNIDELIEKINAEQEKLKSNDDRTWNRNKPYFKGLALAHELIRQCDDVIEINITSIYE